MQYADIALPVKVATKQETFTYRIPPALLPDIKIGQRVTVSFYRRSLIGTVVSLRATPPKIKGTIKEINSLVEPFALFTSTDLELIHQTARLYGASIGQVLDSATPQPAKRITKRLNAVDEITAKNQGGQSFGLYQPVADRYDQYEQLIDRAVKAQKRCLILFPGQELATHFAEQLSTQKQESVVLVPPGQALTEHYAAWIEARIGTAAIFVGTRKSIFMPIPRLGLIIIDSPSLYGYKEEQFPYYNAVTVAKFKAKLFGAHLVVGDGAPRLTEWHEHEVGEQSLLTRQKSEAQVTLIDATINRGLLPEVVKNHIQTAIDLGQKVLLLFNRKGTGRFYHCLDCETAIYCPRCDTLLTVYDDRTDVILRCPHCQYETKPPYRCTTCSSYRLGSVGLGVESFASIVTEHFSNAQIKTLSAESEQRSAQFDILISTSHLFHTPPTDKFAVAVAFQVDQSLHGARWDTKEEAFLTLSHIAERTKHLIIPTAHLDSPVISAITQQEPSVFYRQEWDDRLKHGFPPAAPIIRMTLAGANEDKVKLQAEQTYNLLKEQLPNGHNTVLPPSPIGTGKKRGKFRYQIVIKSALTNLILTLLPKDWQIDPEPTEL